MNAIGLNEKIKTDRGNSVGEGTIVWENFLEMIAESFNRTKSQGKE